MKRTALTFIILVFALSLPSLAQDKSDNTKIDIMLIRGDFKKAIDTCNQILAVDSLNSGVYYKLGLANQSILSDDKAFDCFLRAATLSPDNNNYRFYSCKKLS